MDRRRLALLGMSAAAATTFALSAQAQTTPPAATAFDIQAIATLLRNMGYEPKIDSGQKSLDIVYTGNYNLTMTIASAGGGAELLCYIFLTPFTPDDLKKVDFIGLMAANDANLSYFSMAKSGDHYSLYIQKSIVVSAVTPATMRLFLSSLASTTYKTENLWKKPS